MTAEIDKQPSGDENASGGSSVPWQMRARWQLGRRAQSTSGPETVDAAQAAGEEVRDVSPKSPWQRLQGLWRVLTYNPTDKMTPAQVEDFGKQRRVLLVTGFLTLAAWLLASCEADDDGPVAMSSWPPTATPSRPTVPAPATTGAVGPDSVAAKPAAAGSVVLSSETQSIQGSPSIFLKESPSGYAHEVPLSARQLAAATQTGRAMVMEFEAESTRGLGSVLTQLSDRVPVRFVELTLADGGNTVWAWDRHFNPSTLRITDTSEVPYTNFYRPVDNLSPAGILRTRREVAGYLYHGNGVIGPEAINVPDGTSVQAILQFNSHRAVVRLPDGKIVALQESAFVRKEINALHPSLRANLDAHTNSVQVPFDRILREARLLLQNRPGRPGIAVTGSGGTEYAYFYVGSNLVFAIRTTRGNSTWENGYAVSSFTRGSVAGVNTHDDAIEVNMTIQAALNNAGKDGRVKISPANGGQPYELTREQYVGRARNAFELLQEIGGPKAVMKVSVMRELAMSAGTMAVWNAIPMIDAVFFAFGCENCTPQHVIERFTGLRLNELTQTDIMRETMGPGLNLEMRDLSPNMTRAIQPVFQDYPFPMLVQRRGNTFGVLPLAIPVAYSAEKDEGVVDDPKQVFMLDPKTGTLLLHLGPSMGSSLTSWTELWTDGATLFTNWKAGFMANLPSRIAMN